MNLKSSFMFLLNNFRQAKCNGFKNSFVISLLTFTAMTSVSCADAIGPDVRNANVPSPKTAEERKDAINEGAEPIIYLPLGEDVLMPQSQKSDPLPDTIVGPFELRGETLAGALQLIMDGVDIPVAFESSSSLTQTITVTNLKGPLGRVVNDVCSLANMYCSYQGGVLSVKDREIFTVTIPPIAATADVASLLTNIAGAIESITSEKPITDPSTRTIVYRASQRTSEMAQRYFQRLRSNTALIIYETYIWEVTLDAGNSTGIKWSTLANAGRFNFGINLAGVVDPNVGTPISIGLPTTKEVNFSGNDILNFISTYGAVKTISQPQITVLSGASAKLRIAEKENYVASITRTLDSNSNPTVSTSTSSVDSGFTLNIGSNWDNSTVYGTISILLQELKDIETFKDNPDAIVQLPKTTERELNTSVRIRPGDTLLIAGLVKENDKYSKEGLGINKPIIPSSRTTSTGNTELVFLLKPRVVVFTSANSDTPHKSSVGLPESSFTQPDGQLGLVSNVEYPETPLTIEPQIPIAKDALTGDMKEYITPTPLLPIPEQPPSIEIQPLPSLINSDEQQKNQNPSVIVNYDVLGR